MRRLILRERGPVYVDANPANYWFEKIERYASASAPLWDAIHDQRMPAVTSALTLLEVLVKPLRDGNDDLIATYRRVFLNTKGLDCLGIDQKILDLATRLRADHRLKTPDAIHAATALNAGASMLVTNDSDFRRVSGLHVVLLDEIVNLGHSNGPI